VIFKKTKSAKNRQDRENLLDVFPPSSQFAEAYRTLRTNLFFTVEEKELKSLVVTSSIQGEGKTTTGVNLGFTIAQSGRSVLLMDLDLRRPHLSNLFDLKARPGITHLVTDVFGTHLSHGSLDAFSVHDLVQLTRLQARTCLLDLENEETQAALMFDQGRIVDVHWKNRPNPKKLASTLIQDKLLTEKEAALALGHQKKSVQRLGAILHTMGFVEKKDIVKALSVHTIEAVKAATGMEAGHFAFSSLPVSEARQALTQDIDVEKLYTEFKVSEDSGVFLKRAIHSAIVPSGTPGVDILPSGAVPHNPAELVGSDRMRFLLDYIKDQYDFIIIDTPPIMPTTDALLISPRTDGMLLVIRSGATDRKVFKEVLKQIQMARQPILGTVLNGVDMKKGYYRYYKKYYAAYDRQ